MKRLFLVLFMVVVTLTGVQAASHQYISYAGEKTIQQNDEQILLALMVGTAENCTGFSQCEYVAVSRAMNKMLDLMGEGQASLTPLYADRYARRIMRLANANRSLCARCKISGSCNNTCRDYNSESIVLLVLYDKIFALQGGMANKYKQSISREMQQELKNNAFRELYQMTFSERVYHEVK